MRDLNDNRVRVCHQGAQEGASTLCHLIDDDTAVYDHRDATRAPAMFGLVHGIERKREERDVDARGLACTGRQI
jgi:hypothetical protein